MALPDPVGDLLSLIEELEAVNATSDFTTEWHEQHNPLTFGPFGNNLGKNYAFNKGSWHINFLDKFNSDVAIIFLSKMTQLYRKVDKPTVTLPLSRKIKDLLIKDYFPHHLSREW